MATCGDRAPGAASPSSRRLSQVPERPGLTGEPGQGQARVQGGVEHRRPRVHPRCCPRGALAPTSTEQNTAQGRAARSRAGLGSRGPLRLPAGAPGRHLPGLPAWAPGERQEGWWLPSALLLDTPRGQRVKAARGLTPPPRTPGVTPGLGGGRGAKAGQGAEPGAQGAGGQGPTRRARRGCEHPRPLEGQPPRLLGRRRPSPAGGGGGRKPCTWSLLVASDPWLTPSGLRWGWPGRAQGLGASVASGQGDSEMGPASESACR